ncbi:FAD-binding and (Fe-S)-binding domain-containing protein [Nocardioides sp.]|uniref:FAD-binding and (Fe-S)-binding domain-containing protein n=1 Tax=Nocardioides sp. TaxID=35761 RepID=UPI002D7F06A2|nr:FAD-binding and (Fe-S)-binding domain-containing protein [Nocardioides sp.]HET8959186.1 FAD-binding and (Fe-S)-binding domain-containing protein [Nocardioides sp.]
MTADLVSELRRRGVTDVDDSALSRALYSSDASLYRVVPQVVARPRHPDEIVAVLDAARALGVPLTMRGAGTSIAGNAVGPGIVVDTARHLDRIVSLDPESRTAVVWPGVVHASLTRQALAHGLRFGPDPSTHTRCTIGGMIGNNACGSRALGYGRTADNVAAMKVVFGTGEVAETGGPVPAFPGSGPGGPRTSTTGLASLVDDELAHVRTSFGRFSRQVSGYSFEHLLPENGRRADRFLVGSEGTLGLVLEATVELVPDDRDRRLLVLGYPSMAEAADAVPGVLSAATGQDARVIACEGLDSRIVDLVRTRGRGVPPLPRGSGWLFVEVAGAEAPAAVESIVRDAGALDRRLVDDPAESAALWRIREDGAGLAARSLDRPAYSGWEDAAVPPDRLGAWLREFDDLLGRHGLDGVPYGHFGDGCVHVRIDFEFDDGGRRFRDFLTAGAHALKQYGGSLSGEHGDGRARSELLPLMYDERSLRMFAAAKAICDPGNLLNPGVLVDPAPLDADLRPPRPRAPVRTALRLSEDGGSLADAVHRCTGVGKCVTPAPGGVMCPSWVATREEKDSTRGRARVLQEALDGSLVHGLDDPAVHQALDLCLACKGCASDCPTGVDMGAYKAEVLHQSYAGRRRPRSHYTLGRLPDWVRRSAPLAGLANRTMKGPAAGLVKAVAGIDPRRSMPELARDTLRRSAGHSTSAPDVWIWADTFTDHFLPRTAHAATTVLEAAGLRVGVIPDDACCGLTLITTGQLDRARKVVSRTVATLAPYVASGVPVIGLEPSCLAALRTDAVELTADPRAADVASGVCTLAEVLGTLEWQLPDLSGLEVVAQPHCHHASVLGWEADERLLTGAGATVTRVPGCCGLAGNFGMERGHYDVSVAVAESHLLPAVRSNPGAVVLADGLSCRHQLADLAGVPALHLAELIASRLGDDRGGNVGD